MDSTIPLVYLPPPSGFNYIAAIEPCYTFVLISLPFSAILVPILFLIVFFSTPHSRRTLLFVVNVAIVLLGIIEGILGTTVQSLIILRPRQSMSNGLFITYLTFAFCTPIVVDCVLILRLRAVYPATLTQRTTRITILAIPLLCSFARFACVSVLVSKWARSGHGTSALLASPAFWPQNRLVIADWSIQLFENVYCSALFLFRIRGHKAFSSRMYRNQTFATHLRALFYIAISNFVFPTLLSIVQLVFIFHDPSVIHGATVLMVNNYISIFGVLFSTLWCSSDVWKGAHNSDKCPPQYSADASSAFPQSIITLSGIAPNLNFGLPDSPTQQRMSSNSLSRGHRSHPYLHPYGQGDRKDTGADSQSSVPPLSKGHDSASYLQPLGLPRVILPVHADVYADSEADSPSRSPITPRDGETVNDTKPSQDWMDPCPQPCEQPPRTSESDSETEIAFARPALPASDPFWWRRQWRLLSARTPEALPRALARRPSGPASADGHHPPPFRPRRASSDLSEAERGGGARPPSWDAH